MEHRTTHDEELVYLGLGSNLGDRQGHITEALRRIDALEDTQVVASSGFYETEPRFVEDQPEFINAVAAVRTGLGPRELLEALLAIEQAMGRVRAQPKGPRTIDLDILLYGRKHIAAEGLEIPHPGLTSRAFVLVPLMELAPELVHPTAGRTIRALAEACEDAGWVRRVGGDPGAGPP